MGGIGPNESLGAAKYFNQVAQATLAQTNLMKQAATAGLAQVGGNAPGASLASNHLFDLYNEVAGSGPTVAAGAVESDSPITSTGDLGGVLRYGGGALALLGGAAQVSSGARELANAHSMSDRVDGGADLAGGGLNVAAGTFALLGAGTLAAGAAGAGALVDGGRDVYLGVEDGNGEQTGEGAVELAGGGMMVAGAATLDPLLLGAGAVTYGAAALYKNRGAIQSGLKGAAQWVESHL